MYKPNINLPLASSYNGRGIAGFTNTVTNNIDQKKVNCFYDLTKNSITGGGRVELTKRPGVTIDSKTHGVSTQAAYLVVTHVGQSISDTAPVVFSKDGNDLRADDGTSSNIITSSAAAFTPCFVDKTNISGVEQIVLQYGASNNTLVRFGAFFPTTLITDVDFLAPTGKMEFMDGFAFYITLNTPNIIFNSDLNSLANWPASGFIAKQIQQDYPVGLARLNNQILAFGDQTVEAFYNAGNATGSPLAPIKQLHQRIGMVLTPLVGGTHYYAILEKKMFFVGRKGGGVTSIGVFSYDGSGYAKVSTATIDKILLENPAYSVNSFGFHGKVGVAFQLTAPTAVSHQWLMYFPDWNDWFEWSSSVFSPVNNGEYFLGVVGNAPNKLYRFSTADNWQDNGTSFTKSTQFKLPQDGHQRKRMAEFGVLANTARASNQLKVEFSDDDYQSFYTVGNIELQRDIKTLNRGGSYRQRAVRLSSTNALETRLSAFIARIE